VRNSADGAVAMMSSRILKHWVDKMRASCLETVAADHEKSAHGSADLDAEHAFGDFGGRAALEPARCAVTNGRRCACE